MTRSLGQATQLLTSWERSVWTCWQPMHSLGVTQYGWKFDDNVLTPVAGTSAIAPPSILQSIACSCKTASLCANQRCSCNASGLSCTAYCKCGADDICANKYTQSMTLVEAHDDTSDDESDNDDYS